MTALYHFDLITGEHLRTSEARLDPIDKAPMVPAHATLIKPPAKQSGKAACFDGKAWTLKADQRGIVYWTADGKKVEITEIGATKPKDALNEAPPPPLADQIAAAQDTARTLADEFRAEIAGFTSDKRRDGWVLKGMFAVAWAANEAQPSPLLSNLASVAEKGFTLETQFTGETPSDLRDRSIRKATAFFLALQLVEGIERAAENSLPQATSAEDLAARIQKIQALKSQALEQLEALQKEGTPNA